MAMTRRAALILALASPAAAAPGLARADRHGDQARARAALAEGRVRPLSEILSLLGDRLGGHVVAVELEEKGGRFVYEIKVLTPRNRRREIKVDAATGRILEVED